MQTEAAFLRQPSTQLPGGLVPRRLPNADVIEVMGMAMPFARNCEIYGENEPAEYLYKVISGTVRTYKVLADGRRQIGAFHMPGDVFGFETGEEHTFSAEAIKSCPLHVGAHDARIAAGPGTHAAADQERAGARRNLSPGDGRARIDTRHGRTCDVATGHR